MTPRPPSCAIAIASDDSVTVSMAALRSGTFSRMLRVSLDETSTWVGSTVECCGTSSTSSKVRAVTMPVSMSLTVSSGVLSSICDSTRRAAPREATSGGRAVALLVFLAAAAGTRIIAADLGLLAFERFDHVVAAGARRLRTGAQPRHLRRRLRRLRTPAGEGRNRFGFRVIHGHLLRTAAGARNGWCFLAEHGPQPEQGADDLLFDARLHVLEERIRSEEHTSELQSQSNLVCRLLLE